MARRGGGGRPAPRAAPRAPVRSPPQPVAHAPPPAPVQPSGGGSMLSGIGSTIAQGVAFGTGSAIAHRAVDAVVGPRTVQHEYAPAETPAAQNGSLSVANMGGMDSCANQAKAFQDCISNYGSDISKCQFYVDMLNECRRRPAPEEAERIKQFKGRVFPLQDEPDMARVWLPHDDPPGLAMARAFGDLCLNNFGLTERDEFIVLATDGDEKECSHYAKTGQ